MNNTILTLGLYKGSGGPSKSVRAMQQVLDARVVSWVDPVQAAEDQLIWEDSTVVPGSTLPVLRQLLYANRSATTQAEQVVAQSALVSCHSPWRWHNLWLAQTSRKHGVPYWFVPHGGLDPYVFEEQSAVKKMFLRLGGRRFIDEADCVIFTAKAERDKALLACQPKRSEVIYWPLADADFAVIRSTEDRARVRKELGIPAEASCLLYFGRLHPMKRPLETIDALAASGTDAHLILVGNEFGVSLEECRARALERGVASRVHAVGPVYGDGKAAYFSAADAYISLSRRENFNFTAAESMAAGLPLILSPGNDLGGEIMDADCAWILADDHLDTAASAIRMMASQPIESVEVKGKNGRAWALANLQFSQFEERIIQLAAELVGDQ